MERIREMIGLKVYVILKSGRNYTGVVDNIADDIVYLTDKFNEPVIFSISEISSMEVER